MTHDIDTVLGWRGETVLDRDGDKIGSLKELYLDRDERPAWGAVHTGLFGLRQTFVPLAGAQPVEGGIQLPYTKDHVNDAPSVDPDSQLSDEDEARLYRHYDMPSDDADEAGGRTTGEGVTDTDSDTVPDTNADTDTVRETSADTDTAAEVVRSEEEVEIGTRRQVSGKARLKKYVVTEHVQRTVPVQREKVRVEYEPAEGESDAAEGEAVPEDPDRADRSARDRGA
jgi:stress response protein YsnF